VDRVGSIIEGKRRKWKRQGEIRGGYKQQEVEVRDGGQWQQVRGRGGRQ